MTEEPSESPDMREALRQMQQDMAEARRTMEKLEAEMRCMPDVMEAIRAREQDAAATVPGAEASPAADAQTMGGKPD